MLLKYFFEFLSLSLSVEILCDECELCFERTKSKIEYTQKSGYKNTFCSKKCKIKNWRKKHGNYGEGPHGTLAGYFHCQKPRCRPCLDAMKNYRKKSRKSKQNKQTLLGETDIT